MIRLFNDHSKSNTKAVYMAPTKVSSLCTRTRANIWELTAAAVGFMY